MTEHAPRVLVVDDSATMRQLLVITARRHGAQVDEAADGLEALKRLATAHYDLLFVDLNMPVLDGLKLIRRVRDDPSNAKTVICVVTSQEAHELDEQVRALGAQHILRKPAQRPEVDAVLRQMLGR